ncbi:hypothetical protein [Thiomicrorhabdus lithotrophica]|uniref:Flagellar protein FliT n=1 Tax=Thiomicrorhabdus lithotrophica TaxID=2949997 RepID=A0ABY8CBM1_9GAMM|nr:hypothetical protein [Thiomicrorhabdus lithotrophica]WEJ63374.1 hypothetical protein NR989_03715 [Thiomicrorhabdus lithotrophica]
MNELELIKLKLLSHSKCMLNMASQSEWQTFSELDSMWTVLLKDADEKFGSQLDSIGQALIQDNLEIQKIIKLEQETISQEIHKNSKSLSSIKQYLK